MYNEYVKISQRIVQAIRPYRQSMNDIFRYRVVTYLISGIALSLLKQLAMILIRSTGRVAVSSGDFDFLFKTWQGILLIVLGLLVLFLGVVIDLNIQIIYASKILHGRNELLKSVKEGLLSLTKFFTPDGIGIVLYIALIAPITGLTLSISLTENLYIPTFISSVIHSTPLYNTIYWITIILFFFIGIIHIFILHGVLLSGLPSNKADDESRALMKANWKDFFKQNFIFGLCFLLINILIFVFVLAIPGILVFIFLKDLEKAKIAGIFLLLCFAVSFAVINSYFQSFYLIRMTQLYYQYKGEALLFVRKTEKKFSLSFLKVPLIAGLLLALSVFICSNFDEFLPAEIDTDIIAHRAGGVEAPENTIAGIEKAIALGAKGAEIDIQRTKDGYYIVNHDANFSRLCSNPAKPSQLTLDEVKDLVIRDPNFPDEEEDVATFEEMLEASKDRIILFVELKGDSADNQMVDDAVKMIREKDMADQCVLISLKYSLIDYAEQTYPEMQTAYLTFVSFGNTAQLNCDYLGLEEESATASIINTIHNSGRKVMVWTPNEEGSQKHFLISDADYIITDNISQALGLTEELNQRDNIQVFVDWLISLL